VIQDWFERLTGFAEGGYDDTAAASKSLGDNCGLVLTDAATA
jgi:hypothetical protein